ncbi:Bifunctional TH2 protein [Phytophthora citrophthora]|uniref:Bifunctional TH2 protein n=1 Tax=Phytophthora citrophthora TaxID=4793 RepID=A0AAD9G4A4_9STRA|nr:Bifunctional TH2 protein [Phytophthora citrophthora]
MMFPTKPKRLLLCTDFDETITHEDTTSVLFGLANNSYGQAVTQYEDESNELRKRYEAQWQQTSSRKFDSEGLHEFLEGYSLVDLRSQYRVVTSQVLQGIPHQELAKAARTVEIRPDVVETLQLANDWKIISANWSTEVVRNVMLEAGADNKTKHIISNELRVDEQGLTTGEIDVKVQSAADKAKWIEKLRKEDTDSTIVYIGDSAMDLLALLTADVGIWVAPDTTTNSATLLQKLVGNYGIDTHPLFGYTSLHECVAKASGVANERPVLFTMTKWSQLKTIIEGNLQN